MRRKLLIIEDESCLADLLKDFFQEKGFSVTACGDGESGLKMLLDPSFDAAIIDVMLPKMDGFAVLEAARAQGIRTPVLFLTARSSLSDKLEGFAAGAEDYLTKPFEIEELEARVGVLLRISETSCGDLFLDRNFRMLGSRRTGKQVKLTQKEYALMEYFMLNAGQILSKEQITERIWGYGTGVEYNHEEVYISFLRRKMRFVGTSAAIKTERAAGYRLEEGQDD